MNKKSKQKFCFDENICVVLDEAILKFFRTYKQTFDNYAKVVIHSPKVTINIYQVQNDYLNHFIQYGLELQDCGFHPDAVSILLENAMGLFLERCEELKRDCLRLQLLYVKKALHLLYTDKESYMDFTIALASESLDLSELYKYFANILDKRNNEVKYVYTSSSSDI